MLGSTTFIVAAALGLAWIFLTVLVVAACRMAGRSDAEIDPVAERPKPTAATQPVKAPVARPRAARFAARS